jgi:hypothetical protein
MIAAAVFGMTMASQAAVYGWGLSADATLAGYAGNTIYVLSNSFAFGDETTLDDVMGAAVSQGAFVDAGRGKYKVADTTFADSNDLPSTFNATFVLVNNDGDYVKWNGSLTGYDAASPTPETKYYTANDLATYESAQGGYKSFATAGGEGGDEPVTPGDGNVPEPTSGLLMLIGAAGLALRRKNA